MCVNRSMLIWGVVKTGKELQSISHSPHLMWLQGGLWGPFLKSEEERLQNNNSFDRILCFHANNKTSQHTFAVTLQEVKTCDISNFVTFSVHLLAYNGQCMIQPLACHKGAISFCTRVPSLFWSFSCYLRLGLCFLSQRERLARIFNALPFLCSLKNPSFQPEHGVASHSLRRA